jgi:DNA replication protein DnaD
LKNIAIAGGWVMNSDTSFYHQGHLVVAAIRVLEHRQKTAVSMEDIQDLLGTSIEKVNFTCKKLHDKGIIEILEGAFGNRLTISDHMKLEAFSNLQDEDPLKDALAEFQKSRTNMSKKVAKIQSKQAQKKKNLFADIEKKFKDNLKK